MSLHSGFTLSINTVMKTVGGIEVDGFVCQSLVGSLYVRVLVPADGSTPQILHHAPRPGVLSGHDVLEFCSRAVTLAHDHLSHCRLLEIKDLTSANDWHFDGPVHGHEHAFRSPSLNALATFDSRSGEFVSFVGCMVRWGKIYQRPTKHLGARLFAKIIMATAMRVGAPTPGGSLVT